MIKKGYSMVGMLVCLLILSVLLLISLNKINAIDLSHYDFINDYLIKQSKAILNKEEIDVSSNIYFNSMGHINRARTIDIGKHEIIIHLGNGYITYE